MEINFQDRREAGKKLAKKLSAYAGRAETIVLALPRGGVPVAFEIANELKLPLDLFLVRKLGVPGHEELAMGAVASGGVRYMNRSVLSHLNISEREIEAVVQREEAELRRRDEAYRMGRSHLPVEGKTVLLIDDGIATGSTMMAAIQALREAKAVKIVVGVPTIAASSIPAFENLADDLVAVIAPANFMAVGQWYDDFSQTTDQEVKDLLERGRDLRAA